MTKQILQSRVHESGVVSLLTVIFFMIFVSLITMGFITIVTADQRQTTDNDLSASALTAARSGVEDGKRLLLYCWAHPGTDGCNKALNSQGDCDAVSSKPTSETHQLVSNLSIPIDENGEGATGGATAYEQYFTCLTIQTRTPSLKAPLTNDSDFIRRLQTVSPFTKLQLTWSVEGSYALRSNMLSGWPTLRQWNIDRHLPVIQFQTIPYPYGALSDIDALEARTTTLYIVPCGTTCTAASVEDIRASVAGELRVTNAPIMYAPCTAIGGHYSCSITLNGYDSTAWQYYIRASVLYADSATLQVSAVNDTDPVLFDNVQPWIDVTGRASDVFKRVRTEVGYQSSIALPKNALDSAAPICKDMTITTELATSTYNCE